MSTLTRNTGRYLLQSVTVTGAGSTLNSWGNTHSFQAIGTTSSGTGAATILVQVSTNGTDWMTLGSIVLTLGTASTNNGFTSVESWPYIRGNVTAISGTGASVSLIEGA